jgi:hypothetical protein
LHRLWGFLFYRSIQAPGNEALASAGIPPVFTGTLASRFNPWLFLQIV